MGSFVSIERGSHQLVCNEAPLQEVFFPLFQDKDLRLFMLRGDLVHPIVSGNKLWKLKYNLLEAIEQKKARLVTFGGAYSNHLLAVACAAASLGLNSLGLIRGEEKMDNPVLRQCQLFGMTFEQLTREQYREKEKHLRPATHSSEDYLISEGGSNTLAVKGCAEAVPETEFDHIFLPVGTGGTLAGFATGATAKKFRTRVEGIAVLKGGEFLIEETDRLAPGLGNWKIHLDYHHGGYAKTSPALFDFIREFASATGILLDPVYTGKMMFALCDVVRKNYFARGTNILAVHTGGLTGWAGFASDIIPRQTPGSPIAPPYPRTQSPG